MRVETAGVGQHPYLGVPDGRVLRAHRRVAVAERRPVGGDPHDREPAWLQSRDLFVQYGSALDELLGAELVRAGGGARDDVGDAEPEAEQLLLLVGPEERSVKPELCRAGQKRFPGRAKWYPVAAEYRPGLMPANTTRRPAAMTSGIVRSLAASRSAGVGRGGPVTAFGTAQP